MVRISRAIFQLSGTCIRNENFPFCRILSDLVVGPRVKEDRVRPARGSARAWKPGCPCGKGGLVSRRAPERKGWASFFGGFVVLIDVFGRDPRHFRVTGREAAPGALGRRRDD